MRMREVIFILVGLLACSSAQASNHKTFNVLACEPEWAALAFALGDDSFNIYSATTYQQDPHHIQARPSLIAKARQADLLICSGAELEVGWLPLLLRKSSNPRIQRGAPGYFMAADHVPLLNKRNTTDKSEGDVHGAGNPHIHLDPNRMLVAARALSKRLVDLLPDKKSSIEKNLSLFEMNTAQMMKAIEQHLHNLNHKKFVVQHDSWVYLFDWLNIKKVAELEPKPGLPPTTSHLALLLNTVNKETTDLIIYSSYQNDKAARWMQSKTGIKHLQLPYSVDQWNNKKALQHFYKEMVIAISQSLSTLNTSR